MGAAAGNARAMRWQGDRGTAIVELALVTPLLVTLLLGVLEAGTAWASQRAASTGVRAAARAVAQAGPHENADLVALQSLLAGTAELELVEVERVVIYRADGSGDGDGGVPSSCLAGELHGSSGGGGSAVCNVYSGDQLEASNLVPEHFGCGPGAYDRSWCPTTRDDQLAGAGGPTWIGVHVELRYSTLTGIFPADGQMTFRDSAVTRVEPAA